MPIDGSPPTFFMNEEGQPVMKFAHMDSDYPRKQVWRYKDSHRRRWTMTAEVTREPFCEPDEPGLWKVWWDWELTDDEAAYFSKQKVSDPGAPQNMACGMIAAYVVFSISLDQIVREFLALANDVAIGLLANPTD